MRPSRARAKALGCVMRMILPLLLLPSFTVLAANSTTPSPTVLAPSPSASTNVAATSFTPTKPQFYVVNQREVNQAVRPWFFGGSCVRADPDKKPTKSERDGTITGIFFTCLFFLLILTCLFFLLILASRARAFGVTVFSDDGAPKRLLVPTGVCLAGVIAILFVGIAAVQEVRKPTCTVIVSIMPDTSTFPLLPCRRLASRTR